MLVSLDLSRDLVNTLPMHGEDRRRLEHHAITLSAIADTPSTGAFFSLEGLAALHHPCPGARRPSALWSALVTKCLRDAAPHCCNVVVGIEDGRDLAAFASAAPRSQIVFLLAAQPEASSSEFSVEPPETIRCLIVAPEFLHRVTRQLTSVGNAFEPLTEGRPVTTVAIPSGVLGPTLALELGERLLFNDTVYSNLVLEVEREAVDDELLRRLAGLTDWKVSASNGCIAKAGDDLPPRETLIFVASKSVFAGGVRDPSLILRTATLRELLTRPTVSALLSNETAHATSLIEKWVVGGRSYRLAQPEISVPAPHPYFEQHHDLECGGKLHASRSRNVYVYRAGVLGLGQRVDIDGATLFKNQDLKALESAACMPLDEIIETPTIVLTPHESASAYYHFLLECLPAWSAVEGRLDEACALLQSSAFGAFHAESLDLFAIRRPLLRDLDRGVLLNDGIVTSAMSKSDAVDFLRAHTRSLAPTETGRRLYVSRRSAFTRKVLNEEALMPLLARFGFERIECETLDLETQIRTFQSAAVVCGPHGAGLTNIAFCDPGTRVIEILLKERFPLGTVFWDLACAAGHRYCAVFADKVANQLGSPNDGDFFVNERMLEQAFEGVLGASP